MKGLSTVGKGKNKYVYKSFMHIYLYRGRDTIFSLFFCKREMSVKEGGGGVIPSIRNFFWQFQYDQHTVDPVLQRRKLILCDMVDNNECGDNGWRTQIITPS